MIILDGDGTNRQDDEIRFPLRDGLAHTLRRNLEVRGLILSETRELNESELEWTCCDACHCAIRALGRGEDEEEGNGEDEEGSLIPGAWEWFPFILRQADVADAL
jgi:hypothetical protein